MDKNGNFMKICLQEWLMFCHNLSRFLLKCGAQSDYQKDAFDGLISPLFGIQFDTIQPII